MDNLSQLASLWVIAKEEERQAIEHRREIEDMMTAALQVPETLDGTLSADPLGYQVKVTGRITRRVDGDKLQEIAAEVGLSDHLGTLFRWKPEINMQQWKKADESITRPLLGAITSKPGRPSYTVHPVADKG